MASRVHERARHREGAMRILVTNDDGIYSPGLAVLAEVAAAFGQVRIVAPDVEQSSVAHAVTATRPLHHRRARVENFEAYRVDGTPADCVALGTHLWEGVDLVVSGINLGLNVGNSMWHSGTLAAAKQAALLGIRGVAFSAPASEDVVGYAPLRPALDEAFQCVLEATQLPLVNVNFPAEPKGLAWTRQSVRHYDGRMLGGTDPLGREHFWFVPRAIAAPEEGTDRWAIEAGLVSMTPLRLDLTDHAALERLRARAAE
jgi:5'-nucleotidase